MSSPLVLWTSKVITLWEIHVFFFVSYQKVLKRPWNKQRIAKERQILENEQAKMLNKSLGSTQETKCTVGYKMAAFVIISFWRSLSIFLWWIKTWAKLCWNGNKYKAHCTLSLEESNSLMIKKVTQHMKHLLWPKKHASYQEAWKENTNGRGLKKGKTKCSARLVGNFQKGKTCNTPEDRNK